jgi:hypothetical protein
MMVDITHGSWQNPIILHLLTMLVELFLACVIRGKRFPVG